MEKRNFMKETLLVTSSHHEIFLQDQEHRIPDDFNIEKGFYNMWGRCLTIFTETSGSIRVTFQDTNPEEGFIYRGTETIATPSKLLVIDCADTTDVNPANLISVPQEEISVRIFTNRDDCASEVVLVTQDEIKVIEKETAPLRLFTKPESLDLDFLEGDRYDLGEWEGFPIKTVLATPTESFVAFGDSEQVRLHSGSNAVGEIEGLMDKMVPYWEDEICQFHFIENNETLEVDFVANNALIKIQEGSFQIPSGYFSVTDALGYDPYFLQEIPGGICNVKLFANDEDEPNNILFSISH